MGGREEISGRPDTHRFRNFDAIRLFAAVVVVFSHGFMIAEGVEDREPFQVLTGEIGGSYGVYAFFVLSGFLITRSRLQSPNLIGFAWRRFVRIYPAFFLSVTLGILVTALFFTTVPTLTFLTDSHVWTNLSWTLLVDYRAYWFKNVLFYSDPDLIGTVINGVLWTLSAEVMLYISVAVLFGFGILNRTVTGVLCVVGTVAHLAGFYPTLPMGPLGEMNIWFIVFGAPGFFAGAFLYFQFQRTPPRGDVAAVLALAAVVVPLLDFSSFLPAESASHQLFPVLAAYPLLWLGHNRAPDLGNWTRFGDLSYGIYIFGWPIQQIVRVLIGEGWSGWAFFPLCIVPVLGAAWLSWHFIESRALRYRNLFDAKRRPEPPASEQLGER